MDTITTSVIDSQTIQITEQAPQPPVPAPIVTTYTMDEIMAGLTDCDNGDAAALSQYNGLLAEHDAKRQPLLTMKKALDDWNIANPPAPVDPGPGE